VTFLAATWGVVLRALVGRYQRQAARQEQVLDNLQRTLVSLDARLNRLEGRMAERDRRSGDERRHYGNDDPI
jgi:uncharacterized coiled-coil protein SlyX